MTPEEVQPLSKIRINRNSRNQTPDPTGIVGKLYGWTEIGNPIIGFFQPKDGNLYTWDFDKGDVEVVQ